MDVRTLGALVRGTDGSLAGERVETRRERQSPDNDADLVQPEDYARWRKSRLGAITERIEQDAIFALSGDLGGKRVLDLGSGDGTYSVLAYQRGAHVVGLDLSGAMLEASRRRAAVCGSAIEWCQASAHLLPFSSSAFDLVIAVTALCFVKDPVRAAKEIARVLRPGGSLIIGELGRYSPWAFLRRVRGWIGSSRWRHARFWTLQQIRGLFQQAGLDFRSARGCVYYPPIGAAARLLGDRDRFLSPLGEIGAAFLAVRGDKPRQADSCRNQDSIVAPSTNRRLQRAS